MNRIIGGCFIVFGIIWESLCSFFCDKLCPLCSTSQIYPCFSILLFVGLIFLGIGLSLISIKKKKFPKVEIKK
jgi:uncharacterized membrane protein YczE